MGVSRRKLLRRRFIGAFVVVLVLMVVALAGINLWLDAGGAARRLAEAITRETGLSASIGDLSVQLLPLPSIALRRVTVGENDFRMEAGLIRGALELKPLLRREVVIQELRVRDVHLYLPGNPNQLSARMEPLRERLGGVQNDTAPAVMLERVVFDRATVHRIEDESLMPQAALHFSGTVLRPMTRPYGMITGQIPMLGELCAFTLTAADEDEIAITAEIEDIDVRAVSGIAALPIGIARGRIRSAGPAFDELIWTVEGQTLAGPDGDTIGGHFSAQAGTHEGRIIVNDATWTSDGLTLRADATQHGENRWAIHVMELGFEGSALHVLANALSTDEFAVVSSDAGRIAGSDLYLATPSAGRIDLLSGDVTIEGLGFARHGQTIIERLHGTVRFVDNAANVQVYGDEDCQLEGVVAFNLDERALHGALSGNLAVTPARFHALLPYDSLTDGAGLIAVHRLEFAIDGAGVLHTLVADGAVTQGRMAIDAGDEFRQTLHNLTGGFKLDLNGVEADLRADGSTMGSISASVALPFDSMRLHARAQGDGAKLAQPLYWSPWAEEHLAPAFAAFGAIQVEGHVSLPTTQSRDVIVDGQSTNGPGGRHVQARVAWTSPQPGASYQLGDISVRATVPAQDLKGMAPELAPGGSVRVSLDRPGIEQRFTVTIDLSQTELRYADFLHKTPGMAAQVTVAGATNAPGWRPETLTLTMLEESYTGRYDGDAVVFERATLDLERLAPLMREGYSGSGRIHARVRTIPLEVSARFENTALVLPRDTRVDALNGLAENRDGLWNLQDLRVQGSGIDLAATGQLNGREWNGRINGPLLDIRAVQHIANAYTDNEDEDRPASARADSAAQPFRATADIEIDEVLYGPAESAYAARLTAVRATMELDEAALRISDIRAAAYGGQVRGSIVRHNRSQEQPGRLNLDVTLDTVGAELLDYALFAVPRNMKGRVSGAFLADVPEGLETPMHGINGEVQLAAADGTLGEIGMATQLLSVLSSMQIWNINRAPQGREGLFYDTLRMRARADSGIVRIDEFSLHNPYLRVGAAGTLDFPRDTSRVAIDVDVLEGVFRPLNAVPVVGQATSRIGVIKLESTGPPANSRMRVVDVVGFSGLRDRIKDLGGAAREEVVDRVLDAIGNVFRGR